MLQKVQKIACLFVCSFLVCVLKSSCQDRGFHGTIVEVGGGSEGWAAVP